MRFSSALALAAFFALGALNPIQAGQRNAVYLGDFEWRIQADWFGGLSALEISEGGDALLALSDQGYLLRADIRRSGHQIKGLNNVRRIRLTGPDGETLAKALSDSEGLAVTPGGDILVSFEQTHDLRRYTAAGIYHSRVPGPSSFRLLIPNKSLEALALDADGTIYTLPERPPNLRNGFPLFAVRGDRWGRTGYLPARGGFLAVGADFGPDGRFYLLERRILPLGFQSRVRSWRLVRGEPTNETEEFRTGVGSFGNLEGLSVWRDGTGTLRLTMISDDNMSDLFRSQIVEYAITE